MRTRCSPLAFFLFALTTPLAPDVGYAQAQGAVAGRVVEADTGTPLPGANVAIEGSALGTSTDADGRYRLEDVPAGPQTLAVSFVGYEAVEAVVDVRAGEVAERDFALASAVLESGEVIVTGQALSQQRAIAVKREARPIVAAAVQDDIGRLPDLNTAAVIRRLPGVAVQNDQAEPRFAVVRGLNPTYNHTSLDGGFVASPERGGLARAVPLDVVPASLLSRLEVFKTVTPDMDHNAIGGVINMVTRSAFDGEVPFVQGQLFGGVHEQAGAGGTLGGDRRAQPWRGNATAALRFGPGRTFGVVGGFDYSIRNFEIPQVEVDDADYTEFDAAGRNVGLGAGNGLVVPTNQRIFWYNNRRERIGGHLKLEWRPSEKVQAEVAGAYVEFNDDERRDESRYELGASGSSSQPAAIRQQTPTGGITDTGFGIVGLGRFTLDRQISNVRSRLAYAPTPALQFEARATLTAAALDNPESTEAFQTDTTFGARYDTGDFFNTFSPLDPGAFFDPASYAFVNRGELDRFVDDRVIEAATDVTWTSGAFPLELQGGLLYRDRAKEEGFDFFRYTTDVAYTLADVADRRLAGEAWQGGYRMPFRVGSAQANDYFRTNRSAFAEAFTTASRSEADEAVVALYGMATLELPTLTVIGGVRYEGTTWEGGDPVEADFVDGSYGNLLVDVQANWDVTPDVRLRGAFTQTLGRPNLSDLTRGEGLDAANATITGSNPDLLPRTSDNVDLSAEWYLPGGLRGGRAYSTSTSRTRSSPSRRPSTGRSAARRSPGSSGRPTPVMPSCAGWSCRYEQRLFFFPAPWDDVGLSANATFIDGTFRVPLADGGTRDIGFYQQPDRLYNLTGFYAGPRFEVRLSYNWTDAFIDSVDPDNPNQDEYWDAREQLDLQVRLNVTGRVSVIAEAVNLTNAGRTELTGPGRRFLQESARFGRTFWLGVGAGL